MTLRFPLLLTQRSELRVPSGTGLALLAIVFELLVGGVIRPSSRSIAQESNDGQATVNSELEAEFHSDVLPLIKEHCYGCHDTDSREGDLDLTVYQSLVDVNRDHRHWANVMQRVAAGEMPPRDQDTSDDDAIGQPEQARLVNWIRKARQVEAERTAGDPGVVLARRLSNAEYNYCIRDLTGFDLQPTRSFPVDPSNESGFDNSGESLTISPALAQKYVEAARYVVDHLVLTPTELRFAPYAVTTDTDRDKYCVNRIVQFYRDQPTRLSPYFQAAHQLLCDPQNRLTDDAITEAASQFNISPKYLRVIATALQQKVELGPWATIQRRMNAITATADDGTVAKVCDDLEVYALVTRRLFEPYFANLNVRHIHDGAQAFVLWKNDQYARHRLKPSFRWFEIDDQAAASSAVAADGNASDADKRAKRQRKRDDGPAAPQTPEHHELLEQRKQNTAQFDRDCELFCRTIPDAFYISERGRDYLGVPREQQEKGRLLNAGFHSMMGYYRDDQPLCDLVLDDRQRESLDRLWQELDFFTSAPMRQYQGFLWFERTDSGYLRDEQFDFARPENLESLTEPMILRLAKLYRERAIEFGANGDALQAIDDYFVRMNQQIRAVETARKQSESKHLQDALLLAGRAFRRPLTDQEQTDLRGFYQDLRQVEGLTHEEAIQDLVVSILLSPQFLFRLDLLSQQDQTAPLNDWELASRLSFFLWSSLPDQELLDHSANGDLHQPEVWDAQVKRMLKSDKVRNLAVEFGGNWLDFRRFEEHNAVDRNRFPQFDDELRSAMFEEPVRLVTDTIQNNRPLTELIFGERTFVNRKLANYYLMHSLEFSEPSEWQEVAAASRYGRGGLLTMAVFLTKNAPGLRTSPVKRGYWVARRLLGETIPAPPPNVPDLPDDESKLGDLTLREALAKHREHSACAGCHTRIDPLGLVFEAFGPVGESRVVDLGGHSIDDTSTFADGSERSGIAGLREYIAQQRQADFVENFCRKLLTYALGRSLQLSDELLVQEMIQRINEDDGRVYAAFETIVCSPQFMTKRGRANASNL